MRRSTSLTAIVLPGYCDDSSAWARTPIITGCPGAIVVGHDGLPTRKPEAAAYSLRMTARHAIDELIYRRMQA